MICAVYRSSKKADTYLYVPGRDDFSRVPETLMTLLGKPQFVMLLPLDRYPQLARVDREKLLAGLRNEGFFLQLPPPDIDLLKAHRRELGLDRS